MLLYFALSPWICRSISYLAGARRSSEQQREHENNRAQRHQPLCPTKTTSAHPPVIIDHEQVRANARLDHGRDLLDRHLQTSLACARDSALMIGSCARADPHVPVKRIVRPGFLRSVAASCGAAVSGGHRARKRWVGDVQRRPRLRRWPSRWSLQNRSARRPAQDEATHPKGFARRRKRSRGREH